MKSTLITFLFFCVCAVQLFSQTSTIEGLTDATTISASDKVWLVDVDGTPKDVDATLEQVVSPFAADPSSNASFDAVEWAADLNITSAWGDVTGTPTTLAGYGIADAYTQTATDAAIALKLDITTATATYEPIDSAYTKAESDAAYDALGAAAAVQADVDANEAAADAAIAAALHPGADISTLFNDLGLIDGSSLDGSSVDSGVVAAAYIDPAISRDSELAAALNNQSFTRGLHFYSDGSAELGAGMFDLGLSDFAIILKLKLADYTPASAGILLASHTSGNNRLSVTLEADGDWRLSFTDGAGAVVSYDITPPSALTDGSAYLFIIDLDRSANATLYVDGSSSGTVDISAEAAVDLGSGNSTQGDLMVDANLSGAAAGLLLTNFSLSAGDVAELSAVGPSLWPGFSPELRWAGSTGPASGVYSKLSGTGTISSATISSFDVDAGASGLALNHTGSFGTIKSGQALRVNVTVSGDLGTGSVYVVSGSDASSAVSLALGTADYLLTAPARLLYADVRFTLTSVGGMSVAVNSIESVGLRAALDFDEGIGYQLRDTSSNNYDCLLSLADVYHISPAREGYVRDFAVDAYNGGTGNKELVSSTRNILPAGAILTGAEVKNNTGTITAGLLDLKRSSRTLYNIIGDNGQGLSGGQQTLIVPNESIQTSSYLNVALDGAGDADATSLDLRVNYKLID